jgi:trans-aconitate 2-methyltransferase
VTVAEREHWLSVTDDPDWRRNHIHDPDISTFDTLLAITSALPDHPARILEIGCGFGRLTAEIHYHYPFAVVTGLDVNQLILDDAIPGPTYVCADNLDGLDRQDAIYSVAVFQHLDDDEKRAYIEQAAGLLSSGGVLRVQFIEGDRDNFCDHWVTAEQMETWCRDAGFTTTAIQRGLAHPQWSWLTAAR